MNKVILDDINLAIIEKYDGKVHRIYFKFTKDGIYHSCEAIHPKTLSDDEIRKTIEIPALAQLNRV